MEAAVIITAKIVKNAEIGLTHFSKTGQMLPVPCETTPYIINITPEKPRKLKNFLSEIANKLELFSII